MRSLFRIVILFAGILSTTAFGWNTSHVVIMIMDGARYCETWGDAAHTNIPKIAALAGQATVLTQFRTALPGSAAIDWSETCPGHARITTGTVQNIANDGTQLPSMPGMFQEYRKQKGVSSNATWVITSKDKLYVLANSSAAGWNNAYQPSINCGINGNGTGGYREDSVTHPIVKQKLTNDRPALMIINYKGPDSMGHANNWNGYIAAIKEVDGYADDLWATIQSDAQLKDRTALIILNDHGRHTSNFVSHGDSCDGCTHIMFVALGPDFKKNYITGTVSREHVDIAPTVAVLLGFTMSNAAGARMSELLPVTPVVSGAPASFTTNKPFTVTLDVDTNFGYWSTNSSPFAQLTTSGVNITVGRTTTLRYFGSNAAGVSATNSRTYTFDTTPPLVSGAPDDLSTNSVFSITLTVNENSGYVSFNGGAYVQFTTPGTNISITKTTTLSYFGRDALGNTGITNTRTYTVTIINGLDNPSAVGGSDGFTIVNIPEHTTGAVYTISGRFVASLAAHDHGLFWDIHTADGRRAAPGVYLCRLSSAADKKIIKVMVQR